MGTSTLSRLLKQLRKETQASQYSEERKGDIGDSWDIPVVQRWLAGTSHHNFEDFPNLQNLRDSSGISTVDDLSGS